MLLRGVNDDEAPELLGWALREGYQLRFIEQMPLDAQHGWDRAAMVTADEILEHLRGRVRAGAGAGPGPGQRAGGDLGGAGRAGPRRLGARRSRGSAWSAR